MKVGGKSIRMDPPSTTAELPPPLINGIEHDIAYGKAKPIVL